MGFVKNMNAKAQAMQAAKDARPQVRVVKVKGERHMQSEINTMESAGWTLDQASSRKALYTLSSGVFTRKQIHTLTFRKGGSSGASESYTPLWTPEEADARNAAVIAAHVPAPSSAVEMLKELGELRDSGVLTSEDFDSKKVELLKQI